MTIDYTRFGTHRLYGDLSYLWPHLSPPGEYAEEAREWLALIRRHLGPGRHTVLELGIGGGHNASHLAGELEMTGVDLSANMLALSTKLNPSIRHVQGDMRSVRLGETFDAVLVHDAVAHLMTEDDLRATLVTAHAHLGPGGLVVLGPDWIADTFESPTLTTSTHGDDELEISLVEYYHQPDPTSTSLEGILMYYIRKDGHLTIEEDRLELGIFPVATWKHLMDEVGFGVTEHPTPEWVEGFASRLFVGIKR